LPESAIYSDAVILVIDVDSDAIRFLTDTLARAGYAHIEACTALTGVAPCLESGPVDLIVLDLGPNEAESLATLAAVRSQLPADDFLPIVALGPMIDPRLAAAYLKAGARDYLGRPVDAVEFLARIESLIATRSFLFRLIETKHNTENLLRRLTRESQEGHLEMLERLNRVAELRDDPSGGHPGRVGRLSGLIAQEMQLPADETRLLLRAAPLHDLGNVGIPDEIVRLEGNFTEEQREQMRAHASLGACLLKGAENNVLQMAEVIAQSHHERWDGFGYPRGLNHDEIPLPARIVAVADAFDAMTHPGQYKEPCTVAIALEEIRREAGWQFDPGVVDALMRVYERDPDMLTMAPRAPRKVIV
jgi:putative two-component system response regulator